MGIRSNTKRKRLPQKGSKRYMAGGYVMIVNSGCWLTAHACSPVSLSIIGQRHHIIRTSYPLPTLSLVHSEELWKELVKNDTILKIVLTLQKKMNCKYNILLNFDCGNDNKPYVQCLF